MTKQMRKSDTLRLFIATKPTSRTTSGSTHEVYKMTQGMTTVVLSKSNTTNETMMLGNLLGIANITTIFRLLSFDKTFGAVAM